LVNFIAPFVLLRELRPMMTRSERPTFVVNVSAVEGRFSSCVKTGYHPHTNAAKAALNMLTRTSAGEFARDNIHMNAVDTGWITNEYPAGHRMSEQMLEMPLDEEDGAARILDPVYTGVQGTLTHGRFYKDYLATTW
jgi:NAD(P)-dependent dehydrogenase (short-subunit alcohol dehydrogenase family)